MRPERVVFRSPPFYECLGLPQGTEDFSIKDIVSELPIEAFAVPVLPGAPRFDEEGSHTCSLKPPAYCVGSEF